MKIIIILAFLFLSSYAFAEPQDDMTSMINATVSKEFVIALDANATTGYEWQLANPIDDSLIKLVNSEYVPNKTGFVGSGGKSIWTFKAVRAGKTQISFKYIRSWEKDTPPAKEITYRVNIKASDTTPYWQEDNGEPPFGENGDQGDR